MFPATASGTATCQVHQYLASFPLQLAGRVVWRGGRAIRRPVEHKIVPVDAQMEAIRVLRLREAVLVLSYRANEGGMGCDRPGTEKDAGYRVTGSHLFLLK